jgi:hypothetical protein
LSITNLCQESRTAWLNLTFAHVMCVSLSSPMHVPTWSCCCTMTFFSCNEILQYIYTYLRSNFYSVYVLSKKFHGTVPIFSRLYCVTFCPLGGVQASSLCFAYLCLASERTRSQAGRTGYWTLCATACSSTPLALNHSHRRTG